MKKIYTSIALLVGIFLFPLTGSGELKIPFTGGSFKVGYVDILKALNESNKGKEAKRSLEGVIKSKQRTIDDKGQDIKKITEDLNKQSAILSESSKKEKVRELERLRREYQRMVKDSQDEVKSREMEFTQKILSELRDIVRQIGREESFSLIITDPFGNLDEQKGLVLYFDKRIDLTQEVIRRYNKGKR